MLELVISKPATKGEASFAELMFQDGDTMRVCVLGQVRKGKAGSDFGEIDCWEFVPDPLMEAVSLRQVWPVETIQRKTKREVCTELSARLFVALIGTRDPTELQMPEPTPE